MESQTAAVVVVIGALEAELARGSSLLQVIA
jgi:hypothetical protein